MKAALNGTKLYPHVCFAHLLQLAVFDTKSSTLNITQLIFKVLKIVSHYNKSCTATARLDKVQENMQEPISADLSSSNPDIDTLSTPEWRPTNGTVQVLRPFTEATKEFSGNLYSTASMVIGKPWAKRGS
ncbi:hypothetical protein PR048_020970 [Dryococelus australis]|uniref:Uncharacterized protein n=1 Tax=Dryococelus australis TaxID=614101 RepID=A0ABQ9GWW7_9NEOP|nr:hypothetical protein PR048_020970 [Dryococelus australis]